MNQIKNIFKLGLFYLTILYISPQKLVANQVYSKELPHNWIFLKSQKDLSNNDMKLEQIKALGDCSLKIFENKSPVSLYFQSKKLSNTNDTSSLNCAIFLSYFVHKFYTISLSQITVHLLGKLIRSNVKLTTTLNNFSQKNHYLSKGFKKELKMRFKAPTTKKCSQRNDTSEDVSIVLFIEPSESEILQTEEWISVYAISLENLELSKCEEY